MKKEEKEVSKKDEVEVKTQKAIVTSRVFFISVLDKIYLVILGLCLIGGTIQIFDGSISSLRYGFWTRVGNEFLFLLILFIIYLFMNWFYRCAAKTMLCLTKNEVYKEDYIPFKRSEHSIPLNKITKVSTVNLFWIFRAIIIHQYHAFPLIFMTWNNQEFKDKLNELITTDSKKIENEYEHRNIITEPMYKYVMCVGIALAIIVVFLGVVRFFAYLFSDEGKMVGTYTYEENKIVLNRNGSCSIQSLGDDVIECTWTYDKDENEVLLRYDHYYLNKGRLTLEYNSKEHTLQYEDMKFKK